MTSPVGGADARRLPHQAARRDTHRWTLTARREDLARCRRLASAAIRE
ncbi:hypothetical protein [Pseudonocardia aurantiaca]|uniref:Uncharacterized protein n=1 Tax=Pseudonocardia aurantiaca TaxID=75290 RepID=A0ABW4FSX8_9PSEU